MTDNQFPPGEDGSATGADLGGRGPREVPPAGNDTEATVVMARRPPPVEIGDVLGHTYRVEALLGKGGMGVVYRARHVVLASEHAIKVILWELSTDPQIVALLNQEAQTLRSLKNDAVVEYQGLMLDEYGRRYLVMEFVDGPSLASELRQRRFSPDEVRRLRDRVARGLAAAHAKGVFHRDVSPDNIILPHGLIENAKIIDFGIAKSTASGERTIIGGDFAGKYSYASPEQAGMYGGKVDARSDIYSLGLMLASAAIGFGGKLDMGQSPHAVFQARQSVPDLGRVPEELRGEIAAMLEPNPADRPQTMEEVLGLSAPRATARVAPAARRERSAVASSPPRAGRRSGAMLAAAIGGVAILAGGGAYEWFFAAKSAPPHAAAQASTEDKAAPEPVAAVPPDAPTADAGPAASPLLQDDAAATTAPALVQDVASPVAPSAVEPGAASPPEPSQSGTASSAGALAMASPISPAQQREIDATIQQALKAYPCAAVTSAVGDDGTVQLEGLVASAEELATLRRAVANIPDLRVSNRVAVYRPPQCEAASLLKSTAASVNEPIGPQLRFNHANRVYKGDDILMVDAAATSQFAGYLYVDYFDAEGQVVHMLPTPLHLKNSMNGGESVTLGAPKEGGPTGERVYEISEPFGPALVTAISSPRPLFPPRAQEMESAKTYLAALSRALKSAAATPDGAVVASYALIKTVPK